jgi:hypothetical protein
MMALKAAAAVAIAFFLYAPFAAAANSGREARVRPAPARTPQVPAKSSVGTSTSKKGSSMRHAPRHRVDDLELPQLG